MANQTETYRHGGNPSHDLSRFNLQQRPVIDFSTSLNPFGPPPVIKEYWHELIEGITSYPSVEGKGIAEYYRTKFGLSDENILAGNGSTEMIYLIPRVLGLRNVLIFTPSYHDYERAFFLTGASVRRMELSTGQNFAFPDFNDISRAIRDTDAVLIGRPNNPTGTLFPRDAILDLASKHSEKYFIIDEAFVQFLEDWEEESLITGMMRSNILVIHSLTKFYALAGLRMGGVIGPGEVIDRLKNAKEPWTINGIAERAAYLLEGCDYYEEETRLYVNSERKRVYERLLGVDGILAFPSFTNFFLCRWIKTDNLDDLIRYLLKNSVYIRDCRNFPGLKDNYFRFGLRAVEENDRLISLLTSFSHDRL